MMMTDKPAKVFVKESPINGTGVFASVDIPGGAPILKIDDSRLVTNHDPLRADKGEYEHHCDYLAGGKVVLMQAPERYINHSCDPNSFVKTLNGVRYVFALRAISAGEEINYDYCINGYGDTLWECNCGSTRCIKLVHSDFFHLPILSKLNICLYWIVGILTNTKPKSNSYWPQPVCFDDREKLCEALTGTFPVKPAPNARTPEALKADLQAFFAWQAIANYEPANKKAVKQVCQSLIKMV